MMITDSAALAACLAECQEAGRTEIRCELSPEYSARISDAALRELLVTGLPMAQGIQQRIIRSRGRGAVLTARIRYRDGVRMLEYWRAGEGARSAEEMAALEAAQTIAAAAMTYGTEEAKLRHMYDWVCSHIQYAHTSPGKRGYERLVGAAAVLKDGRANCQGFADVMYLLCGLCGIECQYRCGRGERSLHLWNSVRLDGIWQEVDASKGARELVD